MTAARAAVNCPIGIHCHNDSEVAVANTLAAVRGGATQVQGTDQRLRRALRQREPGFDHRQSAAQARLPLRAAGEAQDDARSLDAGVRAREYHAVRAPAVRRPQRVRAQGRACTCRGSSATPRPTSTSIRRCSATIAACCSRSSRAAPISCTRPRSSASRSTPPATTRSARCSTSSSGSKAHGYTFDGADASFELLMLRTLGLRERTFQLRQLPRLRRQVA